MKIVEELPAGYRWANEDETERWIDLAECMVQVRTGGTDETDLAIVREMPNPRDDALDQIAEILRDNCPTEALVGPFAHAIVGIVNILFTTGRRV